MHTKYDKQFIFLYIILIEMIQVMCSFILVTFSINGMHFTILFVKSIFKKLENIFLHNDYFFSQKMFFNIFSKKTTFTYIWLIFRYNLFPNKIQFFIFFFHKFADILATNFKISNSFSIKFQNIRFTVTFSKIYFHFILFYSY